MKKRLLALVLCLVMVVGLLPTVFADGGTEVVPDSYTVTFVSHGGTTVDPKQVNAGGKIERPADPTKEGYTFAGWYTDEAYTSAWNFDWTVSSNVWLHAKWVEAEGFTITYERGLGSTDSKTVTVEKGANYALEASIWEAPEGMEFAAWIDKATGTSYKVGDELKNVQANMTFFAAYDYKAESKEYSVTYKDYDRNGKSTTIKLEEDSNVRLVLDGGKYQELSDEVILTVTGDLTIADATKDGVEFAGWKKTVEDKVTVLTAKWKDPTATTYKIYFNDYDNAVRYLTIEKDAKFVVDPNGGSVKFEGETFSITKVYTASKNYTLPDATYSGYVFNGWDVTYYGGKTVFTAKWTKDRYNGYYAVYYYDYDDSKYEYVNFYAGTKLVFDPNGGTAKLNNVSFSTKQTVNSMAQDYTLSDATRKNCTFYGWDLTKVGDVYYFTAMWTQTSTIPSMLNGVDHYAYIKGYPNGTFKPTATITRAEVATIFYRLLNTSTRNAYSTSYNTFTDVPASAWYNTAVSTMAKLGIINGDANGKFRPADPITRAELAAMVARCDGRTASVSSIFSDTTGHWASSYIARAYELGWITGYGTTYAPDKYISRAETVAILNRVLEREPEYTSDLLKNMNTFSDVSTTAWYYLDVQEAANSHTYTRKTNSNYETWSKLTADPSWF